MRQILKAYSDPSHTSKGKLFVKIVSGGSLTIFIKNVIRCLAEF